MRRAAKVDRNQAEIVDALRAAGCSVAHTYMIGQGFPDVIAGRHGVNYLLEIKDGDKPPSAKRLTDDEQKFFDEWQGQVVVVETIEEALTAVGLG